MLDEARRKRQRAKNLQVAMYMGGMTLFTISFTYASVPLYRIFCQKTGFAGTVKTEDVDYTERAKPVSGKRLLTIKFNADVSEGMPWKFIPQQPHVKVVPGEAALVFYKALNKTDKPIIGVASYNVQPEGAAAYFNKIQCFCFEEQVRVCLCVSACALLAGIGMRCLLLQAQAAIVGRVVETGMPSLTEDCVHHEQMLGPNEKIDMPVFFFIDPDFLNDKNMDAVETITLSYTFWKSGDANAPDIATMLAEQERHKAVIYPRPEPVAS